MKEENKYYTPQIEEFCVGFEYESRVAGYNAEWTKETIYAMFRDGWESNIDDVLSMYEDGGDEFRVKYLDSQDIIDCGFIFKEYNKYRDSDVFIKEKELGINQFEVCQITLFKSYQSQILLEYNTHTGYEEQTIYKYLKIKNKHELQTILKQIGVL